jgi:tricorn protease
MKIFGYLGLAVYLLTGSWSLLHGLSGFYSEPDIHLEKVVFVSQGKLWIGSLENGKLEACQLLGQQGCAHRPKFSKDGSKIAFCGTMKGASSPELYTVSAKGSSLKRETYLGQAHDPCCWTDCGAIICSANSKFLPMDKTLVRWDPSHSKQTDLGLDQCSEATFEKGGDFYFTRFCKQSCIKAYRGGQLRQIYKSYKKNGQMEIEKYPLFDEANCFNPMICQNEFYFLSDQLGKTCLYLKKGGELRRVYENEEFSIRSASTDGNRIILNVGADLAMYDPSTEMVAFIEVDLVGETIATTNWLSIEKEIKNLQNLSHPKGYYLHEKMAVSPEGERAVFLVRGDLIVLDKSKEGFLRIRPQRGVYFFDVAFAKDKIFALSGDEKGSYLEIFDSDKKHETYLLSDCSRFGLMVNLQGTVVLTLTAQQELFAYHVERGTETLVDTNIPYMQGKEGIAFSPDGNWIAYSVQKKNLFEKLKIFSLEYNTSYPVTALEVDGFSPVWHPKQAALYFISKNPRGSIGWFDRGEAQLKSFEYKLLAAVSLTDENPFCLSPIKEMIPIDPKRLDKKVYKKPQVGVFQSIKGLEKGLLILKDKALFVPFEGKEIEDSSHEIEEAYFCCETNKGVIQAGGELFWADLSHSLEGGLELPIFFTKQRIPFDAKKELDYLFFNVHRVFKSYFYNRDLEEPFWDALKRRYAVLLPRVQTKKDLLQLLSMMLAELNTLHIFVSEIKSLQDPSLSAVSLPMDVKFEPQKNGFEILKTLKLDPLIDDHNSLDPYALFKEGMVITAINHEKVTGSKSLEEQLSGAYNSNVAFELMDKAGEVHSVSAAPLQTNALSILRLYDWAYGNRLKTDAQSEGKVGYIHLERMDEETYRLFARLYASMSDKEGIVIDLRYNCGGNTSKAMIDEISHQSPVLHELHGITSPIQSKDGHPRIVVLCNQMTCSDGELFISMLKKTHRVVVVGTKTWGGGVGIIPVLSVIPGYHALVTLPALAGYDKKSRKVLVEGEGGGPIDVYVDVDPKQSYEKTDLQLAKALEILLEKSDAADI